MKTLNWYYRGTVTFDGAVGWFVIEVWTDIFVQLEIYNIILEEPIYPEARSISIFQTNRVGILAVDDALTIFIRDRPVTAETVRVSRNTHGEIKLLNLQTLAIRVENIELNETVVFQIHGKLSTHSFPYVQAVLVPVCTLVENSNHIYGVEDEN